MQYVAISIILAVTFAALILMAGLYVMIFGLFLKKLDQGKALVCTGRWGVKVYFRNILVLPFVENVEIMDVSLKRVEIERAGKNGLICKDNIRADIKVAFFVQVNKNPEDALRVAQSVGCKRASDPQALVELFDAKFSEALKTIGKRFDFAELYNSRERFKREILEIIGTDLNGFVLDDAAIDYLEQTPKEVLSPDNILDAEGIKKITDLTAQQMILANNIERDKEKIITKQNVEAQEAILELNRQLAEKEELQKREIASIKAREEAETKKIQNEERLKAEKARIAADEEIEVSLQNKQRQILVATRSKERTDAVETERVERDRSLEINERERIVTLAQIEKEKAVEEERKNIQDVIRERVIVEKAVVQEEEAIKDTRAKAQAEREKLVAVTKAEEKAQEALIEQVKKSEAEKLAAELHAQQIIIEADAEQQSAAKRAEAVKTLADAKAADAAVQGLAEANVMEAKARAREKEGQVEAKVIEIKAEAKRKDGTAEADVSQRKAEAEAMGLAAKADAKKKEGLAEANVLEEKLRAEANGILQKAEAMKKLDGVGRDHEEFKLRLDKDKQIELAEINIQTNIAEAQARVLGEALKSANIDIVGGEPVFFERIAGAITRGKVIDRAVNNSEVLTRVRNTFLEGDATKTIEKLQTIVESFGIGSNDVKNLTLSALILKMMGMTGSLDVKNTLQSILKSLADAGYEDKPASLLVRDK